MLSFCLQSPAAAGALPPTLAFSVKKNAKVFQSLQGLWLHLQMFWLRRGLEKSLSLTRFSFPACKIKGQILVFCSERSGESA